MRWVLLSLAQLFVSIGLLDLVCSNPHTKNAWNMNFGKWGFMLFVNLNFRFYMKQFTLMLVIVLICS